MSLYLCDECGIEYVTSNYPAAFHQCFECRIQEDQDKRCRELGVPTLRERNEAAALQQGVAEPSPEDAKDPPVS